jgi:virginiamycin B lyase
VRRPQSATGPGRGPYAIVVDREDFVWYSEFTTDQIVRFDPRTRESVIFKTPVPNAQVRFLTVAPDGSIWYANFGNSRIGRIGR